MRGWSALAPDAIASRVRAALDDNLTYTRDVQLGVPGSHLDDRVFPPLPFVEASAWLSCLRANPNHIGCHTLGPGEGAFAGTQALESELLEICAEGLLDAEPDTWDGYVASGGTESNIQAAWAFRNALMREHGLRLGEIGLLCSEDTHYSAAKAANLLGLSLLTVAVDPRTRRIDRGHARERLAEARAAGLRGFVAILNMGTTMFGSVDAPDDLLAPLAETGCPWFAHVDAAFGGFLYPLTTPDNPLSFADPRLSSFTLDAHKLLQAPYGTGVHLIRKPWIRDVETPDARYVPGSDFTLAGSRSGANAVAVWMILRAWGSAGGVEVCCGLVALAEHLCAGLDRLGIAYVHTPGMNIVAIAAEAVPEPVAARYRLVPDRHDGPPRWRKVVVMEHVRRDQLDALLADLARG